MKKILITGTSRGIGKATAEKFLAEGWLVVGTSTAGSAWDHDRLGWITLDLSHPVSIERAAMEAAENGPFDVLLNNSGINVEEEDVIDSPVIMSVLRRTLEVNLIGTIDFCERIVPYVRDDGHIISIGSRMGTLNETELSSAPSYSISKAALGMYTVRLASRLRPRGITVSILNPGWTQTDMGGPDAVRTPDQPAGEIFELATTSVPSGRFWKGGKQQAW